MSTQTKRRFGTVPKVILGVILLLVIARAALPWAIKSYINKTLEGIPGYYGHVEDVDVALYRGAYRIQDLSLVKVNASVKEPFVAIDDIDIALDWRALFQGRLKSRIILTRPQLQFIQRETAAASQTSIDESWQRKVVKLYPFDINRFIVNNGLVRYQDQTKSPKLDVYIDELGLDAENISNAKKLADRLPSTLNLNARLMKSGQIKMLTKANLLSEPAEADVNLTLRELKLSELNNFTREYGNFDFEKGSFDATLELAASNARYAGYVKTLAKSVDVVDWKKERAQGDSVLHLAWEGLVGGVTEIFKNQKKDQFAARIPIEGTRKELAIGTWDALGSVLRNAFVQALSPKIENSVTFSSATHAPGSIDGKKGKLGDKDSWGRKPPGGKEPAKITH